MFSIIHLDMFIYYRCSSSQTNSVRSLMRSGDYYASHLYGCVCVCRADLSAVGVLRGRDLTCYRDIEFVRGVAI